MTTSTPIDEIARGVRGLVRGELPGRLARLDSPGSAEAWKELRPVLARYGLDVRPETRSLLGDPLAVARILSAVAEECSGVAAALWADYSAWLPFLLASENGPALPSESSGMASVSYLGSGALPLGMKQGARGIHGCLALAFGAADSRTVTVYAESEREGAFARIPMGEPGHEEDNLGLRACRFRFGYGVDRVVESGEAIVLPLAVARSLKQKCEAAAYAWLATIAVETARAALGRARSYAGERYQGAGLLVQNPVILQMIGTGEMRVAAASSLAERTLAALESVTLATLAKVFATQSGEQTCLDAVQCLGGYGYMRDYGLEKRLRDAKTLCVVGGSNPWLLAEAGRQAGEEAQ